MLQNQNPFGTIGGGTDPHAARFAPTHYLIRRKALKLIGASFYVESPEGSVILYADMKAFKLKDDIRIYTGEDKSQEVFRIAARNIMDWAGTFDVFDSSSGAKLGTLRRKAWNSMLRDEWHILDAQDQQVGTLMEDSLVLALARRFIEYVTLLVPQKYSVTVKGQDVGTFAQTFNPFIMKIVADFQPGTEQVFDRKLGLAAAILMCAVEGKQR